MDMSFTGSTSPNPCVVGDNPTSNTALRLALQAMKERCQQLQNRLSMLEDENLQLRIERHRIPEARKRDSVEKCNADTSAHLKKVEELSRQKSKLSHHIFMVANENKHLWEHLSKLTDEKGVDGSPSGSGDAANSIGAYKPKVSLRTIHHHQEGNQLSLDEIPLRISPTYPKNGSPNQIEWNTTTSIKDCEYPIMDVGDEDAEMDGIMQSELMEILANFEEEKRLLKQQQQGLKAAIDVISKLNMRGIAHPNYQVIVKESEDTQTCSLDDYENMHSLGSEIDETNRSEGEVMKVANGIAMRNKENTFEDRICPLCTKFYAKSTPFDEFNDHVLSHFVEDSDQDSHLSFHEIVA